MSEDYPQTWFRRRDESPDPRFYSVARKVTHIDDGAIAAVTSLYAELLPEGAEVLDLMSSWRAHLPPAAAGRVVGLGMNAEELADNPQLDEVLVADLNADPVLPFGDASFDAVVCCVSVQYLTRPTEVFAEVARVLRPDGPFVITFSNRCFPDKAVAAWMAGGDEDHVTLVSAYFECSVDFGPVEAGASRPGWGDPLYAVWARSLSTS
ncbi:class I SAM-dependent methyltransferase [soil metagenome]